MELARDGEVLLAPLGETLSSSNPFPTKLVDRGSLEKSSLGTCAEPYKRVATSVLRGRNVPLAYGEHVDQLDLGLSVSSLCHASF